MNTPTESIRLTRRGVLLVVLKASIITPVVAPLLVKAAPAVPDPEFVPENDYPFFGGETPEGY